MKLKRLPEDFQVDEISSLSIHSDGPFAVYRLTKTGWNTRDAVRRIGRAWNLRPDQIRFAGLKDKHAVTSQMITVRRGPERDFEESGISLKYLGRGRAATGPGNIVENGFRIVLRSVGDDEWARIEAAVPLVREQGVPNYFDNQRFGSWYPGAGFIAEYWLREDYEKALWYTFAERRSTDGSQENKQKKLLRDLWGNWQVARHALAKSHRRSIVTYLAEHPGDWKGAWNRVETGLKALFLSAFQSHLWNACVSHLVGSTFGPQATAEVPLNPGPVLFPRESMPEHRQSLRGFEMPMPSARLRDLPEETGRIVTEGLRPTGWSLEQLKVPPPRDQFFSKFQRRVVVEATGLSAAAEPDELDRSKLKVRLQFSLPPGSYATMVVKRLLLPPQGGRAIALDADEWDDDPG